MNKVLQAALNLGWAILVVRAKVLRLPFAALQSRAAVGADYGKGNWDSSNTATVQVHRRDFRNNFSALFYPNPVAKVQVELENLV